MISTLKRFCVRLTLAAFCKFGDSFKINKLREGLYQDKDQAKQIAPRPFVKQQRWQYDEHRAKVITAHRIMKDDAAKRLQQSKAAVKEYNDENS